MHRLGVPKSIYLYSSSGNGEVSRAAYHHLQSILLHNGGGQSGPAPLARILYELTLRDSGDALATGQPQELKSEAYLNSTSQGLRSEDAGGEDHIIRARCAPLSPASGFPVSLSQ
jgi:hypothetical protein